MYDPTLSKDLAKIVASYGLVPESTWQRNLNLLRKGIEDGTIGGGSGSGVPTNHASTNTIYGVGSSTDYGHNKLSDSIIDSNSDASSGTAATPKAVADVYSNLTTVNQSITDIQAAIVGVQEDLVDVKRSSNHTLWVSNSSQADEENGSEAYPYKSIEAAITSAKFGDVIIIEPGEYILSDIVTITQDNLTLLTLGAEGQFRVVIDGYIRLDETTKRIGLSGLSIKGGLEVYCTEGLVYADKCDFTNLDISAEVAGYCKFTGCYFENTVSLAGTGLTDFVNCQWESNAICSMDTGNAYFIGCRQLYLIHMEGIALVYGDTQCVAVNSDAPLAEGNIVALLSGSMLKADATFAPINISACSYLIGNFYHDASIDSISGVRLPIGSYDYDILVSYTPNNYVATGNTLATHLEAIDTSLVSTISGTRIVNNTITEVKLTTSAIDSLRHSFAFCIALNGTTFSTAGDGELVINGELAIVVGHTLYTTSIASLAYASNTQFVFNSSTLAITTTSDFTASASNLYIIGQCVSIDISGFTEEHISLNGIGTFKVG